MLEPHSRRHLIEALRPPGGYELSAAIGTSYTLNLLTLLTTPLAFTVFDWEDTEGGPTTDPIALLETMRRFADRIGIFCEAGRIQVPSGSHPLFAYIEDSVFEVTAPKGGSFHPKVWALRFSPLEDGPVFYRLLVSSRNLTFDRSWDTLLLLEGELTEEEVEGNEPLGHFFGMLPELTVHPAPERTRANANLLREELGRVRFEPPEEFDSVSFLPLGLEGYDRWPFGAALDRLLVVSPFVTRGTLRQLAKQSPQSVLVSRVDSLAKVPPEDLEGFAERYVLGPLVEPENEGEAEGLEGSDDADGDADTDGVLDSLVGLHAKLYVADANGRAQVWTGSANATSAAFGSNVEFLVGLTGSSQRCGTETLLGDGAGDPGFRDLLVPYRPDVEEPQPDPAREELENIVDVARRDISRVGFVATVVAGPTEAGTFTLLLETANKERFSAHPGVSVRCWPATLRKTSDAELGPKGTATFGPLSFEALTSFFCFEVTGVSGGLKSASRFVLKAPLRNAPEDRRERVLRSLLNNQAKLMRLILFLLAEGGSADSVATVRSLLSGESDRAPGSANGGYRLPLFEQMVRALARNPTALDRIDALLADLRGTEESDELIPEGWDAVWGPIMAARKKVRSR